MSLQRIENPRLLVVDNDEDLGGLLERTLVSEGCRVKYAKSSDQAKELLRSEVFELVMLDVRIPGGDGFELCQSIKSNPATADTPVMFITAEGRVRRIAERTVPYSLAPINSGGPVRATLELAAGTAERLGIRVGDRVEHPIFGTAR